jgi:hypothetical protein
MNKIIISLLLLLMTASSHACVEDWLQQQQFFVEGVASDPEGNTLYVERLKHVPNSTGGMLTVAYTDPGGAPLANKQVDYNCRTTAPSFTLIDQVSGVKEGVNWTQDLLESYQDDEVTKLEVPNGPTIIDAGFDNAIKSSWDTLMKGEKVAYHYLFARDNKFLKLRFLKSDPPEKLENEISSDVVFFRIAANNLIFRMLSSPIYVGYDRNTQDLKYYFGPSNLPAMKDQKNVLIRYNTIG